MKVRAAIMCDLVRTEDNKKQILIGVYGGDAQFSSLPVKWGPAFWIEVDPETSQSDKDFEAKIEIPGQKKPVLIAGSLQIKDQTSAILVFQGAPFELKKTGQLKLFFREKGARWKNILTKNLIVAEEIEG